MVNEETEPKEEQHVDLCGDNGVEFPHEADGLHGDKQFPDNDLPVTPSFQTTRLIPIAIFLPISFASVQLNLQLLTSSIAPPHRPPLRPPFSFSEKPPRSSAASVGSSPLLSACHKLQKPLLPKSKLEKHFQTAPEEETPQILREMPSPLSGVKTASPSRKRVSPPHHELGSSPSRKGGRRLILRSIPSFPPLSGISSGDPPEAAL